MDTPRLSGHGVLLVQQRIVVVEFKNERDFSGELSRSQKDGDTFTYSDVFASRCRMREVLPSTR